MILLTILGLLSSTALCTAMFIYKLNRNSLKDVIAAWYVSAACLIGWCICLFLFPLQEINFMMVMILVACIIWDIQAINTTDRYWKLKARREKLGIKTNAIFYEDPHPN